MAAIVANLGQPDFADSFVGWLESVHKYPRAFDFKYEPLVSILSINVKSLFAQAAPKEQQICFDSMGKTCYFGFTLDEFEEKWHKKLRALQFAITIYLKEPDGLSLNKFFIRKGNFKSYLLRKTGQLTSIFFSCLFSDEIVTNYNYKWVEDFLNIVILIQVIWFFEIFHFETESPTGVWIRKYFT